METIWVDFNNMGVEGVRLNCRGTLDEIKDKRIELKDGLLLTVWYKDEYENGDIDKISVGALVKYSNVDECWVAEFDESRIILESIKKG